MGIRYGSNSRATSGSNIWQYISGTSGDVELNNATVDGINAPMPVDTRFNLWLNNNNLTGGPAGAFTILDGTRVVFNGVLDDSGTTLPKLVVFESATNTSGDISVTNLIVKIGVGKDTIAHTDLAIEKDSFSLNSKEVVSNNEAVIYASCGDGIVNPSVIHTVKIGGVQLLQVTTSEAGFWVIDGVGNSLFQVSPTGKISTNQVVAGVHTIPNGNFIEIFDGAGVSAGFLSLLT